MLALISPIIYFRVLFVFVNKQGSNILILMYSLIHAQMLIIYYACKLISKDRHLVGYIIPLLPFLESVGQQSIAFKQKHFYTSECTYTYSDISNKNVWDMSEKRIYIFLKQVSKFSYSLKERIEINCLMYTFYKTVKFSTFIFIFRVLQYRGILPENKYDLTLRTVYRIETIGWAFIQEVHLCWTKSYEP